MNPDNIESLRNKLKSNLSKKRYYHSVGVEYTACALAMKYCVDIEQARIAGLMHDCAKELFTDKVEHALKGPEIAKAIYGIKDEKILSAIKWHTTGKEDMTQLEKIIYIADYIEPNRYNLPLLETVRKEAFSDLTHTVFLICEQTLQYLKTSKSKINPNTEKCYLYLKENGIYDK